MIRFFTAVFGKDYVRAAKGLLRSFKQYTPGAELIIFTDMPSCFDQDAVVHIEFDELVSQMPDFYRLPTSGQYRNVFKFFLFQRLRALYPDDDLCWVDADMLVLCDLTQHLVSGKINVMAHGRRDGQVIECGDGLAVEGSRYAIGGLYSLPPSPAPDLLVRLASERATWTGVADLVRGSGDQLTLNHLVARSGIPVHWITDDQRYIYNLEIGQNVHPVVGDAGLANIRLEDGKLIREGRQIAVVYWIKLRLNAHFHHNFSTFQPDVANLLIDLYREDEP